MDKLIDAYRKMFLIHSAEEQMAQHYIDNKIFSIVHLYVGQEAIAVGVASNLKHEDKMIGNHRSHGHYLAKGGNLHGMVAEMLGKKTGCCHGKGGSMHMIDRSVNFIGSTPILGSAIGLATGMAFAEKFQHTDNIVVCFLGDGASEEGVVYESINLASLFKLPLLVVIEDNNYSINSVKRDRRSEKYDVSTIVRGLGANYFKANGNDFFSVSDSCADAIKSIKETNTPSILHCNVFRHRSHSSPLYDDKDKTSWYRDQHDTYENRLKACPVKKMREHLIENGIQSSVLDDVEQIVLQEIRDSIEKCQSEPDPVKEDLFTHVYE